MIEVHVFNAFILPELKQVGWFDILTFINGLVAPSFLFVSGFAFQVSSGSKLDEMRKLKFPFWKKIGRYTSIIFIGYALHLPYQSLSKVLNRSTPEQLEGFFAADVLQCIGVSLTILFIIRLLINSDKIYHYVLIILALLVMILSPVFWKTDFTNFFPIIISNYFNQTSGSLFPIFPWINFILAGAIIAKYFLSAAGKVKEDKFINRILITGIVMLISGHLFYAVPFPDHLKSIIPHPVFFIERLGYIMVFASICWHYSKWRNTTRTFVLDASRESLLIYWFHLLIIYSMIFGGKNLVTIIGSTLNIIECIAATIVLILLTIVAAKIWGYLKTKFPKYAVKTGWAIVALIFLKFLLS